MQEQERLLLFLRENSMKWARNELFDIIITKATNNTSLSTSVAVAASNNGVELGTVTSGPAETVGAELTLGIIPAQLVLKSSADIC